MSCTLRAVLVLLALLPSSLAAHDSHAGQHREQHKQHQPHTAGVPHTDRPPAHQPHSRSRNDWALGIGVYLEARKGDTKRSQADQDRVLEYIFHHIGVTNKFFVEFGFNTASFEAGGSGPNTAALYTAFGWRGLLLDGMHRNDTINLHTEFISPDNIVELFDKYSVPAEPDYVSIDIDSTDVWIFRELLASGRYRPRVFTVEYNANFPLESTVTWPREGRDTPWQGNKVMGSAFGAIKAVGDEFGYSIVWVVPYLDIFFVRDDILDGVTSIHPTHFWASATSLPVHSPAPEHEVHELMEYHTWLKTHDAAKARAAAQEQLREMDIVLTA